MSEREKERVTHRSHCKRPSRSRRLAPCTAVAALLLAGCSSGTSTTSVAVAPITFTDANGTPLTSPATLNAGESNYVEVQLADDPQGLGANWSVYCGSALPPGTPLPPGQNQDASCGTFTPAHTLSGPIPSFVTTGAGYVALYTAPAAPPKQGVVTLYAAATSNPSRFSSVTLTILGQATAVSFAPAPPSTLATGATTQLRAVINNDATAAGVTWAAICAAADCGSFAPAKTTSGVATTYTAPAAVPQGSSVQVVATSVADPTKSATSTVAITGNND